MSTKIMLTIWALVFVFLSWEHVTINRAPRLSFINKYNLIQKVPGTNLSTDSGKSWGYTLGWLGIGVMLLTNIYIIRKRFGIFSWGSNSSWLNYHILFGLVGPTFILFHSNFKIGGLVAISFWSMMIIAVSGILGRYFYVQVAGELSLIDKEISHWERVIKRMAEKSGNKITSESLEIWKAKFRHYVGAESSTASLMQVILRSLVGDIRLAFSYPEPILALHPDSNVALCNYALSVRQKNYWQPFKKALGYWHAFHVPFAILMYISAAIHIAVALTFHVSN